MKLLLTNLNTVKDIKENVLGFVLGGEKREVPAGVFTEKVETIHREVGAVVETLDATVLDINTESISEENCNKIMALLYIRCMAGDIKPEDIYETIEDKNVFIFSMDDVLGFFTTNFCKECKSQKELDNYINEVLADVNTNASANLLAVTEKLDRLNKNGLYVTDVISYNLCETDWNSLDTSSKWFNRRNKAEYVVDTKLKPLNRAIGKFGDQTVRTTVSCGAEIAGNVIGSVLNAGAEAGKSFGYTFSTTIKVGTILTSPEAKAIPTNLKEEGGKIMSLFIREKKQKRVGMR